MAVVVVNYRTPELTEECLRSLLIERSRLPRLRAMIVDGGSADNSASVLSTFVERPEFADWTTFMALPINGGFGWANNQAILELARGEEPPEYVHFLNPDARVEEGAVVALLNELAAHPGCGVAGSQLLNEDGSALPSAFRFPSVGREFINAAQSERLGRILGIAPAVTSDDEGACPDWVTGASFMVKAEALRQAGLFDDGFFLYFEEVELMHRLVTMGWTVRHVPASRVVHAEGTSTGVGQSRRMPPYWYQSRHRYFALTGGWASAAAADVGWIAGRTLHLLASPFRQKSPGARVNLFHGDVAGSLHVEPSIPAWGDKPGRPPAWMAAQ